jgi:tRNA(Arg) A34 adenosine deaminase TadA
MAESDIFIQRAIALSRDALAKPGCLPFGAVIVKGGEIVGEGVNHSAGHFDPTSHGEVEAIRDACRRLETLDLSDGDLNSFCEPCALCVAAMQIAGIRRLYYAVSLKQSASALDAALRPRIDVEALRAEAGVPVTAGRMPTEQIADADALVLLQAWAAGKVANT